MPVPTINQASSVDVYDLLRVFERETLEQRSVVDREHHAVRADAKRERNDGCERETRTPGQHA